MSVERKQENQKSPAELALEQTGASPKDVDAEKKGSDRKPSEKKPSRPRAARKPAAAKAKDEKPQKRSAPKQAPESKEAAEDKVEAAAPKKAARKPAPAKRTRRAPARRREAPEPARPVRSRPVVLARAKYVRSSARKARLVIEHIRGKSVEEARALLRHTPRAVARDIEKLLASAVANAENNHELVGDDLYVKEAYADEGPTLKRFRPRALGRATRIRKRTSHLTLTLTPKDD
jgi:ribosomal protein L22